MLGVNTHARFLWLFGVALLAALCGVTWTVYTQSTSGPCGYPLLEADTTYRYPPNVTVQHQIHNP